MKQIISFISILITSISVNTSVAQSWNITGNNNATSSSKLGTTNLVPLKFFTNNNQRMVIDSLGRAGIGITTPVNILTVKSGGGTPATSWLNGLNSPVFAGFGETVSSELLLAGASNTAINRAVFQGRRSRGTLATPAVVVNDDYITSLLASAYDGSTFQNPALVSFFVDGTPSAGNVPTRISFITGSNAGNRTERLKVGSTGNFDFNNGQVYLQQSNGFVGIGTTAPTSKLEVRNGQLTVSSTTSTALLAINRANSVAGSSNQISFQDNGVTKWALGGTNIGSAGANNFSLYNYNLGNNALTILNNNSNVGIGTTTPGNTLHIFKGSAGGVTGFSSAPLIVENSANSYIQMLAPEAAATGILFGKPSNNLSGGLFYNDISHNPNGFDFRTNGNITQMVLTNSGNLGIGTTTPAYPLDLRGSSSTTQIRLSYPSNGGPYFASIGFSDPNQGLSNICARMDLGFESLSGNSNSYVAFRTGQSGFAGNNDISTERMRITSSGNVGIGTTSPGYTLDVAGRMRIRTGGGSAGTWFMNAANTVDAGFVGMLNDNYVGIYGTGVGWGFVMNRTSGNVGIGTFTPAYKLDVCGTIRAKEVRVESGWCDYVFEKNYKLKSIEELEQFINENKHLPGIAPASEVEREGLKVAEMNKAMMEKIEELTLYVIQLSKENKKLQKEIESLKK